METKRLSFSVDPGATPRPASGVSTDTPGSGSDVYPVSREPPKSDVVAKPTRPSSLPPPPPGLLMRRLATPLPPPFVGPPPAFRPSGVITQLEVAPRLPPLSAPPAPPPALPAPPPLPREARGLLDAPRPSTVDYAELGDAEPRTSAAIALRDGVRRADVRDADVLAAIQVLAREHAFERSLLPRPTELDFDQLSRAWRFRASTASKARTFLALRSGEPAGFVSAGPGRSSYSWEGEIYAAHVHPRFWGTRVAENLAAAAFDHLVQRGFTVVRFWVTVTNIEVLTRLGTLGFRPVAQRFHPQHGGLEEAFVRRLD